MFDDYPTPQTVSDVVLEAVAAIGEGPPPDSDPNTEAMHRFAPEFIRAETFGNLIATSILAFFLLIGLIVLLFVAGLGWLFGLAVVGWIGLMTLLIWLSFQWPKLWYRHARWKLSAESLEIHRGVLWKHRIAVPLGRIQHADVSQGPLLRHFDLGKLTINTAGTSNATIEIDGLSHSAAMALRDELIKQTLGQQVT